MAARDNGRMPLETDWTDVLTPVGDRPQHAMPSPRLPLHERLRPVALALAWETAIAALAVANVILVFVCWVVWNATR